MNNRNQRGVVTLEACISVLVFVILMLLISSLFIMFIAQNMTAHVTLQTTESLALDTYRIENLMKDDGKIGSIGDNLGEFVAKLFGSSTNNPYFVTDSTVFKTYSDPYNRKPDKDARQKTLEIELKRRFVGYLNGGDEIAADEMLKEMNIVDGLGGLNFSESYIDEDTNMLYVVLKYTMEYDFNIFDVGEVEVEQKACSMLWK